MTASTPLRVLRFLHGKQSRPRRLHLRPGTSIDTRTITGSFVIASNGYFSSATAHPQNSVDMVYMPSMREIEPPVFRPKLRVPIVTDVPHLSTYNNNNYYYYYNNYNSNSNSYNIVSAGSTAEATAEAATEIGLEVETEMEMEMEIETERETETEIEEGHALKPQVYTVACPGSGMAVSASPMSEVVDNEAMEIDPFSLTETVDRSRFEEELLREEGVRLSLLPGNDNGAAGGTEKKLGIMGELWNGVIEDLLGNGYDKRGRGQDRGRTSS